ncbi:MAG: amidohydrolase family protein [Chloroflexi bacterium]|nr:amidohydrolase family protein [Chloroflexota bacterium]
MRTQITARFVVGYDASRQDHVVYEYGSVVYDGDTIVFVGHGDPGSVDAVIEAGEAIVGPGFIDLDALADIDHAIFDCWQDPELAKGLAWSEDYFQHRRREVFTREEEALKRRYALAQLLLNGVTTAMPIGAETTRAWCETYDDMADTAAIAAALGIRMYLGPAYRAGINGVRTDGTPAVFWDEPQGTAGLAEAVRFAGDYDGAHGGLVRGCLLPCRIETMTLDLLRASQRAAADLDCPIRLHAAQGLHEVAYLRQWHGQNPIELLHGLGFLGPRTLIPHAWAINGHSLIDSTGSDELGMLADSGTTVIYCPLANGHYGSVLESFDRYRARGVRFAIGTDTFPPDYIRVLKLGSMQTKAVERRRDAGSIAALYRAATLGGATALGRGDLGRLAPGAKADIVAVDLGGLRTGPIEDPIRTLIFNCGGAQVRTVIVNGRIVVADGALPGLDESALRDRARAYYATYQQSFSERDFRRRPPADLFPASFPIVRSHPV